MNAIEISNVNKNFGDFAIRDFNFTLPEGCICGLVGENGAGKSTTIQLLMGAMKPDSGKIHTLGVDVSSPEFIHTKQDIGVVLDDAWFPDSLNAKQIGRIMKATYTRWNDNVFEGYISRMSLPDSKAVKQYSRGMRMKLAIAVALSHEPKLLVLDEATAGLDAIVRDEVLDIFNDFTRNESHSILISSHILSDLEKICDYIAFIHKGKLLFCEEKDALVENYGIFVGTAEQADSLMPEAIVYQEKSKMGGVRALVKRNMVPSSFVLEKPTVEDVILNIVKGEGKK